MTIGILTLALLQSANVAVMVHGAGGGGWEYRAWQPRFEKEGWVVIAEDLLPSEAGLERTTFADYLAQVRLRSERRGGKLVLIGASMGGILALKAAETVKPDAVVLVNSVLPKGLTKPAKREASPAIIRWANGPREDSVAAMPDSDTEAIDFAWKHWRDESGAIMDELSRGISAGRPACPTLVVLGQRDTDIPYEDGLRLAQWAGADVHVYAGMSHVGPLLGTRATEVADSVLDWLRRR